MEKALFFSTIIENAQQNISSLSKGNDSLGLKIVLIEKREKIDMYKKELWNQEDTKNHEDTQSLKPDMTWKDCQHHTIK